MSEKVKPFPHLDLKRLAVRLTLRGASIGAHNAMQR
jgi:hypothetical protein